MGYLAMSAPELIRLSWGIVCCCPVLCAIALLALILRRKVPAAPAVAVFLIGCVIAIGLAAKLAFASRTAPFLILVPRFGFVIAWLGSLQPLSIGPKQSGGWRMLIACLVVAGLDFLVSLSVYGRIATQLGALAGTEIPTELQLIHPNTLRCTAPMPEVWDGDFLELKLVGQGERLEAIELHLDMLRHDELRAGLDDCHHLPHGLECEFQRVVRIGVPGNFPVTPGDDSNRGLSLEVVFEGPMNPGASLCTLRWRVAEQPLASPLHAFSYYWSVY